MYRQYANRMSSIVEPERLLKLIRQEKPLIHHITNWVTISECASMTRATGALPVMAHAVEEVGDMTAISSALVLNIGTLTKELVDAMVKAGKKANEKGIPIVLDAVGAGATPFRTQMSKKLLSEINIAVIKGNHGEIAVLAGAAAEVKGVESISLEGDIVELTSKLATMTESVVAATGKTDVVSNGAQTVQVKNGHEMMSRVVGTGCMAGSVIGSFCAVERDVLKATSSALCAYGIAGEIAAENEDVRGAMTYKESFFDAVENLDDVLISGRVRVEIV